MNKRYKEPLKAVLHGMDERLQRNMLLYFQNVCEDALVIVHNVDDAEIDMIDVDNLEGEDALKRLRASDSNRLIVVLSRDDVILDDNNTFFILKPISLKKVLATFDRLRFLVDLRFSQKEVDKAPKTVKTTNDKLLSNLRDKVTKPKSLLEVRKDIVKASDQKRATIDQDEIKKVSKHRTAQQLNETHFSSFLGNMIDVDFDNKEHLAEVSYSPRDYYQGYVSATFKVSKTKGRVLQLNSSWKPLLIFPHSNEVWLDADDQQLRAFSLVELNKATGVKLSVSAANLKLTDVKKKLERFHDMDAFIWKLAIWTSRGRYPEIIDIKRPIFLLRWPNFTRSIITPHALRMTALLVHEPKTMLEIAKGLKIKPQYVFAFISGAYALGLVRQPMMKAHKKEDVVVTRPVAVSPKKKGLLSRILSRLRS